MIRSSLSFPFSRLAFVLAALTMFCLSPEAVAGDDYGVVTIELAPEVGDVPTDVCVVSAAESPRARVGVQSSMLGAGVGPERDAARALAASFWSHSPPGDGSCGDDGCAAQVRLPGGSGGAELWAACTADSLLQDGGDRTRQLLVLMLDHLEGSPPAIEAVKLTGGIVTVGVRAKLRDIVVTARSIGGHFEPQVRSVRGEQLGDSGKLVRLPIRPRCGWVNVALPPGAPTALTAIESHAGRVDVEACAQPGRIAEHWRLLVPRATGGGSLRLAADDEGGTSVFAGSWEGAWPSSRVRLEPQQVEFAWRQPECVFPSNACPRAEIDGGVQCVSSITDNGCAYRCPPGDDPSLSVATPSTVTFTDDRTGQQWSEILHRSGQILDGFVDSNRIDLVADVSKWRRDIPGARVTHLEVLGTDGSVRRYAVENVDELRVRAPDAGCEPLRYKVVGDRKHAEGSAPVRDGTVDLPAPEQSARRVRFMIHLIQGGGPAYALGTGKSLSNPIYFTGLAQVIGSFRPRRPKLARMSFELRVGGTVGQWGWFSPEAVQDPEPDGDIRSRDRTIWARFLFEPGVMFDLWGPLALGAGVGVGSSWPINGDIVTETSRFTFIISPWLEGRVRLQRWLYLSGQARFIGLERLAFAVEESDGRFRRTFFPVATLLGLYGLTFAF